MSTIWLVTYYGRGEDGDSVDPDPERESAREAYASEGGALRGIATVLRDWCSDGEYVCHKPTRDKLSTLLQREHYRAALKLWNDYAERLHDPAGVYGIGLQELPFDASEYPVVVGDEYPVSRERTTESTHGLCLGFRIGKYGELWPCETCDLSDEEVHDRVQALLKAHPPEKKDHPDNDGCGPTCRGWDVFEICGSECILSEFAITRSDSCGVFNDDDEAVSSACAFIHRITGTPYGELLTDKPKAWCSKCSAPMLCCDPGATICVECCGNQRTMPWQKEWCCDCCGKDIANVVPSCDYDNTLAEELGIVLCEPCGKVLRDMPFDDVVRKIAKKWQDAGHPEDADRLCRRMNLRNDILTAERQRKNP